VNDEVEPRSNSYYMFPPEKCTEVLWNTRISIANDVIILTGTHRDVTTVILLCVTS